MALGESLKTKNVGLIGVGVMGQEILKRLTAQEYNVYACDLSPSAQEFIKENGGILSTAQEVACHSQIILLSLPKSEHVKSVVLQLVDLVKEGSVIVDLSTVEPATSISMSEKCAEKNIGYLDAPILGRPISVGSWLLPTGGKEEHLEIVKPVLLTFAKTATIVGSSGAGNTIKLLNQLMFSTINGISCEVMAIADKAGVDLGVFYDTIANSGAATVSGLFKEVARKISLNDFDDAIFTVDLLCKDSQLGLDMAKSFDSPSMIARSVHTYNEIASANGLGSKDTSAVYKLMKKIYE